MEVLEEWHIDLDTTFMRHGLCVGKETRMFFPKRGEPGTEAIRICTGSDYQPPCPVKDQCLEYAMNLPATLVGVWGGTSQKERRRLRYERDKQRCVAEGLPEGIPICFR